MSVLKNARGIFFQAREIKPGLHEKVYVLADWLAENLKRDELNTEEMAILLGLASNSEISYDGLWERGFFEEMLTGGYAFKMMAVLPGMPRLSAEEVAIGRSITVTEDLVYVLDRFDTESGIEVIYASDGRKVVGI